MVIIVKIIFEVVYFILQLRSIYVLWSIYIDKRPQPKGHSRTDSLPYDSSFTMSFPAIKLPILVIRECFLKEMLFVERGQLVYFQQFTTQWYAKYILDLIPTVFLSSAVIEELN